MRRGVLKVAWVERFARTFCVSKKVRACSQSRERAQKRRPQTQPRLYIQLFPNQQHACVALLTQSSLLQQNTHLPICPPFLLAACGLSPQ